MTEKAFCNGGLLCQFHTLKQTSQEPGSQHKEYRVNVTDKTNYRLKKNRKTKQAEKNIKIRERWWKTVGKINERIPADQKEVQSGRTEP